jgi:predicted PurR-regulated permease PerM
LADSPAIAVPSEPSAPAALPPPRRGGALPARRVEIDITLPAIARVLGTLAILWLLATTWQVIVWMLISLMFVATFNPFVRRLQTRVNRPWAITAVVALSLGVVALGAVVIVPMLLRQGHSLLVNLPQYLSQAEGIARGAGLKANLRAPVQQWTAGLGNQALDLSMLVVNSLIGILTVFVLTIYLLVEGPRAATSALALLPRKERLPVRRMVGEIGDQVGAYMRGQMITSLLAGAFAFLILSALRVPEPLALAFLMIVADVIPLVGPLIGTVPAVLMALSGGMPTALIVLGAYLAYQQIEGNFIVPRVYGGALKLSPLVVLVAFLVGGKLMGMLGVLLALPTAAAIPIIARYITEWRERVDEASVPSAPGRLPS